MITMDAWRLNPTPYGVYSNTERIEWLDAEVPEVGTDRPAAHTIGKHKRFTVSWTWPGTESDGCQPQRGHRLPWRRGGGDWDLARQLAAPGQHDGIDRDRLFHPAARSQYDGGDWDCARDRGGRAP
jgi:hypothetical protein